MRFAGVISEDSPDSVVEQWERISEMPFRVFGLAPQPGLEEMGPSGFGNGSDAAGARDGHVGLTNMLFVHAARKSAQRLDAAQAELRIRATLDPDWR